MIIAGKKRICERKNETEKLFGKILHAFMHDFFEVGFRGFLFM